MTYRSRFSGFSSISFLYLLAMLGIAFYFFRKETIDDYFVNRSSGLWLLALLSVAMLIGAGSFVGAVSEKDRSCISYGLAIPLATGAIVVGLAAAYRFPEPNSQVVPLALAILGAGLRLETRPRDVDEGRGRA